MRPIALFLGLAVAVFAQPQSTLTVTGPTSARPGTTVTLPLTLGGAAGPAALQWTLDLPTGWSASQALGAAATAANKDRLSCNPANGICLLYGLNQTSIQTGVVATYTVQIPPAAAAGVVAMPLSEVLASTGVGAALPIAAGPVYSLRVLARSDIDGDGSTTVQDVLLIDAQARGAAACADDQNGDGRCTVHDVVLVIVDYLKGLVP
jgi:hypothetical protein